MACAVFACSALTFHNFTFFAQYMPSWTYLFIVSVFRRTSSGHAALVVRWLARREWAAQRAGSERQRDRSSGSASGFTDIYSICLIKETYSYSSVQYSYTTSIIGCIQVFWRCSSIGSGLPRGHTAFSETRSPFSHSCYSRNPTQRFSQYANKYQVVKMSVARLCTVYCTAI